MRLSGEFQSRFVFFSFTKRFWEYKNANQPKPTKTNQNERTKHNKGNSFLHAQKLLRGWKLLALSFGAFLRTKLSCKKISSFEIVPITSFYYNTESKTY